MAVLPRGPTQRTLASREELRRLVDDLPDEQVPAAPDELRRRLRRAPNGQWPPAWFAAGRGRRVGYGPTHRV